MGETRKIAAILVADVVGYSRLAGTDEDRTLSRLRGLDGTERRSDVSRAAPADFRRHAQGRSPGPMTAGRRLAAILAAGVGVREHRVAGPKTALTAASLQSSHCGLTQRACETPLGVLVGPTLNGLSSRAIEMARMDVTLPFLIAAVRAPVEGKPSADPSGFVGGGPTAQFF